MIIEPTKKLGIALSGGGARGIAHFGFLQVLEEVGIKPYCVAGVSMGAIAGACFCKGIPMLECKKEILKMTTGKLVDLAAFPINTMGLVKCGKIRKVITNMLGNIDFKDLKIPFGCLAVDALSGNTVNFTSGHLVDAVLASSSFPGIFKPLKKNNMILVDGGCKCRVPIELCKSMGCDVLIAIDVIGNDIPPTNDLNNMFDLFFRLINIADANTNTLYRELHNDNIDMWLEPDMPNVSQFKIKDLDIPYEYGYNLGVNYIDKIIEMIS